jgi:hypothetical protein
VRRQRRRVEKRERDSREEPGGEIEGKTQNGDKTLGERQMERIRG